MKTCNKHKRYKHHRMEKKECISQSRDYAIFSGLQTSRFLLVCWGRFPVAWNGEKNLRIWLLLKQLLSHFLLRCLPPPPLTNESCIFLPMRWCEFCWCSAFLALGLGFGALSSAESSFQLLKFVDFCLIFVCDLVFCVVIVLFKEFQSHSCDSNFCIIQIKLTWGSYPTRDWV